MSEKSDLEERVQNLEAAVSLLTNRLHGLKDTTANVLKSHKDAIETLTAAINDTRKIIARDQELVMSIYNTVSILKATLESKNVDHLN